MLSREQFEAVKAVVTEMRDIDSSPGPLFTWGWKKALDVVLKRIEAELVVKVEVSPTATATGTIEGLDGLGRRSVAHRLVLGLGVGAARSQQPQQVALARPVGPEDGEAVAEVQLQVEGGHETRHPQLLEGDGALGGAAAAQAHAGDAVLMSPACASFDMFDNYEHRARVFCEAVQELAVEQGAVL